ncbi:16S rRNA (adenine(1518)-N(6)/adenine(1519)-N(6))-dimethyltransferase RsmA [Oscillochloris sp. ZM17-4]|uniref:16S rRNA (adenine(1518)-N(6)/adenine(1519)-N(6))- dimethyltransferase RsmA n=1 Tax=Oscillochloris sp. ZM17-4 TaxID=2866714 RepID=UPI001C72CADE|nr:16S rRNA (adenine(1518)-N(6)/adenine(1519)-N(6))-dimethyltransferase RsmA [Oscillochloris sp. ZM17-4]MBX0330332.1 16S rRNA (adenine(1518)-N(6)/adenine(1519)-N(6))-dimethyltransferase RsmA [Oscillochloris sp. ZM17-4]
MDNPYLSTQRVRAALRSLDLRPTRGMGQNFLIDPLALGVIVDAAELGPDDLAVEVGPGLGVLTWELLRRAGRVVAVELDRRLAARLHEEFAGTALRIVQADVLRVSPAEILAHANPQPSALSPQPYKLVANLPYAITAPVLRHFLEGDPPPDLTVVLVQWEVAERICATPGDMSVLAHSVQIYGEPEIVARVPASSFHPAPAVDSAVLRIRRRPALAVDVDDVPGLFRIIKAGFLQPRKQLGNALPGGLAAMGTALDRETALAALAAADVNPMRRAETLSLAEWATIYRFLSGVGGEAARAR